MLAAALSANAEAEPLSHSIPTESWDGQRDRPAWAPERIQTCAGRAPPEGALRPMAGARFSSEHAEMGAALARLDALPVATAIIRGNPAGWHRRAVRTLDRASRSSGMGTGRSASSRPGSGRWMCAAWVEGAAGPCGRGPCSTRRCGSVRTVAILPKWARRSRRPSMREALLPVLDTCAPAFRHWRLRADQSALCDHGAGCAEVVAQRGA